MKYRKILTIMLVSVLICTSISAITLARTSSEEKEIKTRGFFSDFFSRFSSSSFSSFSIFNAFPAFARIFQREAPPIDSDSIQKEKEPEKPKPEIPVLELTMQFVRSEGSHGTAINEFYYGEELRVQATIWNKCKHTSVKLDEMGVRLKTLDFFITPLPIIEPEKLLVIHYIYPFEGEPEPVIIGPGESYDSDEVVLNSFSSGSVFGILEEWSSLLPKPYDFKPGDYEIYATYISNLAPSSLTSDSHSVDPYVVTYNGELTSDTQLFRIIDIE